MKDKLEFFLPDQRTQRPLPLFSAPVRAGFPSPAEDHVEQTLDLNELLIKHSAATFFVRVQGESMQDARIQSGDILIVDRALEAKDGQIVVAIVQGDFTVKRLRIKGDTVCLVAENPKYPPLKIEDPDTFQVWGVVTYVIHNMK